MSSLNEATASSSASDVGTDEEEEKRLEKREDENEECKEEGEEGGEVRGGGAAAGAAETTETAMPQTEDERNEVIRFTMLFNKYNGVLEMKRNSKSEENKFAMFFNKEVTLREKLEDPFPSSKILEMKKSSNFDKDLRVSPPSRSLRSRSKFCSQNLMGIEPQISDPGMMFSSSLTFSTPQVFEWKAQAKTENVKKFMKQIPRVDADPLVQLKVHPTDLRIHNSLTSLSTDDQSKGSLKSKIPSLTALDTSFVQQKSGALRFSSWEHWDDLTLMQNDADKRLNLQISRSNNDNNRRSTSKFKKEEAASASDSKLLYADFDSKKHIKKCDKKSRGDSAKKERDGGSRKQVQWKTEVDVIYFSTHLAANGDRSGGVLGRVMEPLREEWEQQRKGFYAKLVSSHLESHLKDRFISLLNI